jgi:NADH dehydrogenase
MHNMHRILILGGSGFVGRHLCAKLALLPWQVTVPTRRIETHKALAMQPRLNLLQADIHDNPTLHDLLRGQDVVVNLVAQLHGSEAEFAKVHIELPRRLVLACATAGVRRVLHVSAISVPNQQPDMAPSRYLRSKAHGEALFHAAAQFGALDLTVLRPSVIFGAGDKFLNLFARLQHAYPAALPLAGGNAVFEPVWVEDVAQALVNSLQQSQSIGQIYEACGPERYSLAELVQLAGQLSGVRGGRGHPVINLPPMLARLQARLAEWAPGPTLLSRDNLDSMQLPSVASGVFPGLQALGIKPSALSAIAPTYLRPVDPATVIRSRPHRHRA